VHTKKTFRTSLGLLGISENEVHNVAALMAKTLNWSEKQKQQQLTRALERIEGTRVALRGGIS